MEEISFLRVEDYVVLVFILLLSVFIGLYYACSGGKQKTTSEYFMGNKSMGVLPLSMSLLASLYSSNTLIGIPTEVYLYGFNWWFAIIGILFAFPVVAYCFLPVFYELGLTSVFEYLEKRFNRKIRIFTSLAFVINMIIYVSFIVYGPALALSQVTGLNLWASILTISFVGTLYTTMGGIKAVVLSDALQLLIMMSAVSSALIKGIIDIGGTTELVDIATAGGRLSPISFSFDPRIRFTFWGLFLHGFMMYTSVYGTSQYQIQRYLASPTMKHAKITLWLNLPGAFTVHTLCSICGIVIYATYHLCDPSLRNRIQAADQIFPLFVMDTLSKYPGMPGLFVAGIFSGSLSTLSSVLNSLAAITVEDYIKTVKRWRNLEDKKLALISKIVASCFGFFCLIVVAAVSYMKNIQQSQNAIGGAFHGICFGAFLLGLFCPWVKPMGAFLGMVCGLFLSSWVGIGSQFVDSSKSKLPLSTTGCFTDLNSTLTSTASSLSMPVKSDVWEIYKISYTLIFPLCALVVIFIGGLFDLVRGYFANDLLEINPQLVSPVIRRFLPERCTKKDLKLEKLDIVEKEEMLQK